MTTDRPENSYDGGRGIWEPSAKKERREGGGGPVLIGGDPLCHLSFFHSLETVWESCEKAENSYYRSVRSSSYAVFVSLSLMITGLNLKGDRRRDGDRPRPRAFC
jgi:hypothetical protein